MPDPYVRAIGRVEDIDGYPVAVGVDYDTVTLGVCRLDAAMQEEFIRLFIAACWRAGHNKARMEAADGHDWARDDLALDLASQERGDDDA